MSSMLSIFGPTLALYLLGLVFYAVVDTVRDLRGTASSEKLAERMKWAARPCWEAPLSADERYAANLRTWVRG